MRIDKWHEDKMANDPEYRTEWNRLEALAADNERDERDEQSEMNAASNYIDARFSKADVVAPLRYIVVRRRGEETEYVAGLYEQGIMLQRSEAREYPYFAAAAVVANSRNGQRDGWRYEVEPVQEGET